MIIMGHPWIKSSTFHKVFNQEDIKKTKPESIVLLEPLMESHVLCHYCQSNQIPFAVVVNTLTDAIFANALDASYIICEEDDALQIQPVAQEYLFDARILVPIDDKKQIAKIAQHGIDGVIFTEAIV